jgi:hypothetical protein
MVPVEEDFYDNMQIKKIFHDIQLLREKAMIEKILYQSPGNAERIEKVVKAVAALKIRLSPDPAMTVNEAYDKLSEGIMELRLEEKAKDYRRMIIGYWKGEILETALEEYLKSKSLFGASIMSKVKEIKENEFPANHRGFARLTSSEEAKKVYEKICAMVPPLSAGIQAQEHRLKIEDFLLDPKVRPEDLIRYFKYNGNMFIRPKAEEIVDALIEMLPSAGSSADQKSIGKHFSFLHFLSGQDREFYEIEWEDTMTASHQLRANRGFIRKVDDFNPRQPDISKVVIYLTNNSVRIPVKNIQSIKLHGRVRWQKGDPTADPAMRAQTPPSLTEFAAEYFKSLWYVRLNPRVGERALALLRIFSKVDPDGPRHSRLKRLEAFNEISHKPLVVVEQRIGKYLQNPILENIFELWSAIQEPTYKRYNLHFTLMAFEAAVKAYDKKYALELLPMADIPQDGSFDIPLVEPTLDNDIMGFDKAMKGGIDLNSTNMNLVIKRDGHGVPLPLAQQDLAQLSKIQGFVPVIISIQPAANLPILSEIQTALQGR